MLWVQMQLVRSNLDIMENNFKLKDQRWKVRIILSGAEGSSRGRTDRIGAPLKKTQILYRYFSKSYSWLLSGLKKCEVKTSKWGFDGVAPCLGHRCMICKLSHDRRADEEQYPPCSPPGAGGYPPPLAKKASPYPRGGGLLRHGHTKSTSSKWGVTLDPQQPRPLTRVSEPQWATLHLQRLPDTFWFMREPGPCQDKITPIKMPPSTHSSTPPLNPPFFSFFFSPQKTILLQNQHAGHAPALCPCRSACFHGQLACKCMFPLIASHYWGSGLLLCEGWAVWRASCHKTLETGPHTW